MPIELDAKTIALLESYFAIKAALDVKDCIALRDLTGVPIETIAHWFRRRQVIENRGRPTVAGIHGRKSGAEQEMVISSKKARIEQEKALKSEEEEKEATLEELKEQQDQLFAKMIEVAAKIVEKMQDN